MTKEEALYKAKHLRKVHPNICIDAEDFWETVIAALEQEPCTDAISREAVLEAIEDDNRNGHYSCFASNNDAQCFKQIIRDLPSVTPAEKMGRWEHHYIRPKVYADLFWYCSACGDKCGYNNANLFEYCPHCGAKMQEVKE